jgi:hypothetical protein
VEEIHNLARKLHQPEKFPGNVVVRPAHRWENYGFVSLKGGIEWGSVLTRPIPVTGDRLHLNADSWRGKVVVEVIDANDGQPVTGFTRDDCLPITLNSIDETVRWKEKDTLSELHGKTVRLRFYLWQAELYAFWLGD